MISNKYFDFSSGNFIIGPDGISYIFIAFQYLECFQLKINKICFSNTYAPIQHMIISLTADLTINRDHLIIRNHLPIYFESSLTKLS